MSAWCDPKGRLVVNSDGKKLRRGDQNGDFYRCRRLIDRGAIWIVCGWVPMGMDAPPCDGLRPVLPSRHTVSKDRIAPHSCRTQLRWPL